MHPIITKIPGYRWLRSVYRRSKLKGKSAREIFTDIYAHNRWANEETVSGQGSTIEATIQLRKDLTAFIQTYHIPSILDIPCGDFNWMREMNLSGIDYTGADIVTELIEKNRKNWESTNIKFVELDILTDALPTCDLLISKDLLVHLSYQDTQRAIQNMLLSHPRYIGLTQFPNVINKDIQTGEWRPVNLQAIPFMFPKPMMILEENAKEGKYLYIWESTQLTGSNNHAHT